MSERPRPLALIILDGWGYRAEKEANAIAAANTPLWNNLMQHATHTLISGSGRCVGLPEGQMGNSEVGHLNMGAGRIVHQDLTRIDSAIEDGSFFTNTVLVATAKAAVLNKKAIHLFGLLSPGGVHSHEKHIHAMLQLLAKEGVQEVYIHPFLDGRDTPPRSALASLESLQAECDRLHCGQIATVIGRFFAMDRDHRWDRIEKAYNLLARGLAPFHADTAVAALHAAYARGENDEFVQATTIGAHRPVSNGDSVIFMNFRADRARELTHAFVDETFTDFDRPTKIKLQSYVTLTEYKKNLPVTIAFPQEPLTEILAAYLSEHHLKQLRIAETEKYAHVTFFFNGGVEAPFPGEDRVLIPSPKVATYDLKPEMSAPELTARLIQEIHSEKYDVIICNYANADMVGHSGNFAATVKAIETLDTCLAQVLAALKAVGGEALITADHGNAELMFDKATGQAHTAHTSELVPCVYVGRPAHIIKTDGKLSDIAPTLLTLLNLPIPEEMTGSSLLAFDTHSG